MTRAEIIAYNAGVMHVAQFATRCADAMRAREIAAPTRLPFATEALQAVADEAVGLALPLPPDDGGTTAGSRSSPVSPEGFGGAAVEVATA